MICLTCFQSENANGFYNVKLSISCTKIQKHHLSAKRWFTNFGLLAK